MIKKSTAIMLLLHICVGVTLLWAKMYDYGTVPILLAWFGIICYAILMLIAHSLLRVALGEKK